MTAFPRIIDDDRDTITAVVNGKEVRSWCYRDEPSRILRMGKAHEFAEGWFQASRAMEAALTHARNALNEAGEYFDNRADISDRTDDDGTPYPNEEMTRLTELNTCLRQIESFLQTQEK